MNEQSMADLFPNRLSDEAAFALSECLCMLSLACDEKYFAQLLRHRKTQEESRHVQDIAMRESLMMNDVDEDDPF